METLVAMVKGVKDKGLETCMTLGMLSDDDVATLKAAGLDYYNHNIDTSERYYSEVVKTRTPGAACSMSASNCPPANRCS